ncbi:MAG TPA: carboxypeptidase-like regulatory domain-containing protein, partial [Ktedonobacteraceae bacterium]|nr:carboxypeptidase-like regulatory domain-containing protein [Ktedonobacteraceae bacterium]
VTGQSNPSPHVVGLTATSSCSSDALAWRALTSESWLMVSPANGQVKGTNSSFTSVSVDTSHLTPGNHVGLVTFQTDKGTQTVPVFLTLQPRPAPGAPIMGALPLSLNFSSIQGQPGAGGQVVTITNNGGSPLQWHTSLKALAVSSWFSASPSGGVVPPGGTGQVTINVSTKNMTPGSYSGTITLEGTDAKGKVASGSPQTVLVNLTIQPPCTLSQPSASSLLFTGIAGGSSPAAQTVTFVDSGSCTWPARWFASANPAASWLTLSPVSGTLNSISQQGSISASVNTVGLAPGTYTTSVRFSASDSTGTAAQNSPRYFSVTLTVLQPCTLQPLPSTLTFNASQGQTTIPSQALNLSETGSCDGGVSWMASRTGGSWLGLSNTSGTDTGGGSSIQVTPDAGGLAPGTYTAQITISASNNGVVLQGSPQTISVILNISGYALSGNVTACSGPQPACDTSQALANATVTLSDASGTVSTVTTNASGDFTFPPVALGSYTISVSGISGDVTYNGTVSVTVNGDTAINIQTFPA